METILNYIESLNSSRYFAGVVMLLLIWVPNIYQWS